MYVIKIRTYLWRDGRATACAAALLLAFFSIRAAAQPNLSFEIKKPKAYENRTLPSEKSGDTKFGATKRFYNNLVSRFNYYFNANNKLNEILEHARQVHQDDYTQLLSFYDYSLDQTARGQIDTVLYKTTAGILLHDLRSDWVDKLYLLMGKAYFYRKDFDSATTVFQYINYAFAPKDGGYDMPIGSNASNTNGVFTIATRENRSLWKRMASFPPSRNESFIWQARTYIEQDELIEASSLLELVRADPNFPERLRADLNEMIAYLQYKQGLYEQSADHLLLALDNANGRLGRARWEYLAAQMYALAHKDEKAIQVFERSIQHTIDPLMEVNARMNIVALAAGAEGDAIQKNLTELLRMAKRDKYESFRDIIYYAAAQLEIKRKNYASAEALLLNSIRYSSNPLQRQLSFLLLGDMNYPLKKYSPSHRYYDSIQTALLKEEDKRRVEERKPALKIISRNLDIISREDSLQHLAALSPEERSAYVSRLLKQIRKEQGLKDAGKDQSSLGSALSATLAANASTDLFGTNVGDFYFLNASLKARGAVEFRSNWGDRPNVDNWRRQSAVTNVIAQNTNVLGNRPITSTLKKEPDISFESLNKDIPLTPVQIDSSNAAVINALLSNALVFQNQLEDYQSAIETYEELMRRFPGNPAAEQALFNLAYDYRKTGEPSRADSVTARLKQTYPSGKFTSQLNNAATAAAMKKSDPAEKQYANIYDMFISGRFEEAKEAKLKADQQFGKTYWTPQLLYIESIYYVRQRQDSVAINRLQNIVSMFGKSPLAAKANTMIDVLTRRSQIEDYLTKLDLNKPADLATRGVDLNSSNLVSTGIPKRRDSVAAPRSLTGQAKQLTDISNTSAVSTERPLRNDSTGQVIPKAGMNRAAIDNALAVAPAAGAKTYTFNPSDTQYVVVVLNNVDPIFVTEGRNAFTRYNQDVYSDQRIEVYNRKVNNQYTFIMLGPFVNAAAAFTYIDRTRPVAKTRIVPWLTPEKYSFAVISNANMSLLLEKQDVEGYNTYLHQVFPDKF